MLGTISPQTVKIDQQAVVYPNRDHVTALTIKRFDGRSYKAVDTSLLTRVVLVFPGTDPVIAYDSNVTAGVFTWAGSTITVDLSDFAMPASILPCYLIAFDAQHVNGQVLVDNNDTTLEFDFRNVSTTGAVPAPAIEFVSEAPMDGETYGRKDGAWVSLASVVSGVASVNGLTGIVVLTAANVGADPVGTAAAAVAAHVAAPDPHPQYATDTDLTTHIVDTTPHQFVTGVDRFGMNTAAGLTAGVGEMVWNATDATLDIGLPGGVTMQAGQEFLVRVLNNSGATMVDTTVVYISGASGNRTVASKAIATAPAADKTIGMLTQDITNNQEGFCTIVGLVRGVNTAAWAEGSELWLSETVAGTFTNVKPAPPFNAVRVGFVVRSHTSQGSIFVRVQNIESMSELHDVNITAPADGHILEFDGLTQTWLNVPNTGGSGEVNTASNLGAGVGVWAQKVGADLQFKSLVAGSGITLTPTANTITITGGGGSGAVDSVNGQTGVVVLDTDDINEGATNLYFTNARASAAAPVQTVDGQTGTVILTSAYAPLSHVGDTGAAHGVATTSVAGFMSGADKTKLNGIATGATANQTDAFLLARANHTGTQASTTISDFNAATRAQVESELVAGANVTITPAGSGATRTLTIAALPTTQAIPIACSDETTALAAGTAKVTFRMPYAFTLTAVRASLTTAQASGSILTVDINEGAVSILSTKLTIDNAEKTSTTAATAAVISDATLADDAEITIDIDQVGDGTAKGLKVYLIGSPA